MDLPWTGVYGMRDGRVAERTRLFLAAHAHRFASLFISWQPSHRGLPRLADVEAGWTELLDGLGIGTVVLHHTALNLASQRPYDRRGLIEATNVLVERFGFAWVNEDLGFWSVGGRPLPYPQPPSLDRDGIEACVRNIGEVGAALAAPLVVEFPGFDPVAGTADGKLDAYDVFAEVVQRTGSPCNLDTGHLLTWRRLAGHRGDAALEDLDRLPLEHCVEIHCAGAAELQGMFVDTHHGVLHALQLQLLDELMARCPNLRVVTFEDPRFDAEGVLPAIAETQLQHLEARVASWMREPFRPSVVGAQTRTPTEHDAAQEDRLLAQMSGAETELGRKSRGALLNRKHRGVGSVVDLYGPALERWAQTGAELDELWTLFLGSVQGDAWTALPWAVGGISVEDAFGRYLRDCAWMEAGVAEALHLHALARVSLFEPMFDPRPWLGRVSGGWAAVGADGTLYAGVRGKLITGPLPESLAAIVCGRPDGLSTEARAKALGALAKMGLAPVA